MSKHVIIIGAGVIGLSTAYYCAQRGFKVTVVDRGLAQRDGCSFGNAGMVVPSHFTPLAAPGMIALGLKWMWNPASPLYIRPRLDAELIGWGIKFWRAANVRHVERAAPLIRDLSLASRSCFEELSQLPGVDFGLVQKGLLMLCQTEHAIDDESRVAAKARELGIPAEVLDSTRTAELDPGAQMSITGSVYFPLDCHLSPARFMTALQSELEQLGTEFIWESEAKDVALDQRRNIRAVHTSNDRTLEGDEFVLSGGAWSPQLAKKLNLHIPMQAGKGYSLTLTKPRALPRLCSILTEARVAVTPIGNYLRVGGTMEIAGMNEGVSAVRVQGIIDSFCRYYTQFQPSDFDGIEPWCGLRPCSPDGLPYVGRTERYANLSIAAGHAMMGLSLAPITGQLVAQILSGEKPQQDISMLSPDRYH